MASGLNGRLEGIEGVDGGEDEKVTLLLRDAENVLVHDKGLFSVTELSELASVPDEAVPRLAALAHLVRLDRAGPTVEVEGILSAKTGGCPEDCHFCSQSAHFPTLVRPAPFLDNDSVIAAAEETALLGATEFCLVLAVRGPSERIMQRLDELVPLIGERTGLRVAVSAGILDEGQAQRLASIGVHRYNHNLETSRSYFSSVVTTHSYDERYRTCELVAEAGMELCCGAILGLGETVKQRLELLKDLQVLSPGEVPLNFLNPRPGTPFADRPLLSPIEAIRWIAIFRLALPNSVLRYGGGREVTLKDLQASGLTAGVNALIIGNYLTTLGRPPEEDLAMIDDLKMPIGALGAAF